MEKESRSFRINYLIEWTGGVEISKIRAELDAVEKLGATHIEIDYGVSFDSPYIEINAICKRIETDEEYKNRTKEPA